MADEFIKIVKNYFDNEIKRPEILGRIGYSNIVPFNFIKDREFSVKIAKSKLRPVQKAISEKYRIDLEFEDELKFIDYSAVRTAAKAVAIFLTPSTINCLTNLLCLCLKIKKNCRR